jgi:glycosyltransferase involved in cell wall biosynthesis
MGFATLARSSDVRTSIAVVTPTLNRPEPLRRALASVVRQELPAGCALELVVVDNSADANAKPTVEDFAASSAAPIRYRHLARPGVAGARNLGVATAEGEWIAFLDDDEEARPRWLCHLMETARLTDADAIFGPIAAEPEAGGDREAALLRHFARSFDEADQAEITHLAAYLGTNNSMFHRRCLADRETFDLRLDGVGGEDSLLLQTLGRRGCRFAWAAEAEVIEWVPSSRLRWGYIYRRKFLSGQIRTMVCRMLEPPRWGALALWMAVGAIQATLAGGLSAAMYPLAPRRSRTWRAVAWGGLGKIFWAPRFRAELYGRGHVS